MTKEEYIELIRNLGSKCEICNRNFATEMKGGIINNQRGIFICCKECKSKIKGTRLNE